MDQAFASTRTHVLSMHIIKPLWVRQLKIFLILSLFLTSGTVNSANIEFEENYLGPFGRSLLINVEGTLQDSDTKKLHAIANRINYSSDLAIHINFNSPGGSLVEGLRMGRYISELPGLVTTNVGVGDKTGKCASACVFAYLGGEYRFLKEGSRLGVHRFYFGNETKITAYEGVAISQVMSAEISAYLAQAGVDLKVLTLMSQVDAQDIYWIPREELERLRVVTGPILKQSSEFKHADGHYYLLLWQQSFYGENKVAAICTQDEGMFFIVFIQPPQHNFDYSSSGFEVVINGSSAQPSSILSINRGPKFIETEFRLYDHQLEALKSAHTFGARNMALDGLFIGFEYVINDDKLLSLIKGCKYGQAGNNDDIGRSTGKDSSKNYLTRPLVLPNTDLPGGDYDNTGIRNISQQGCLERCQQLRNCLAFSWVARSNWCWLKNRVISEEVKKGVTSVIVRSTEALD